MGSRPQILDWGLWVSLRGVVGRLWTCGEILSYSLFSTGSMFESDLVSRQNVLPGKSESFRKFRGKFLWPDSRPQISNHNPQLSNQIDAADSNPFNPRPSGLKVSYLPMRHYAQRPITVLLVLLLLFYCFCLLLLLKLTDRGIIVECNTAPSKAT